MNLKWIAYPAMLLDHFAAVFLPEGTPYFVCRMLGRLAFPLFVYSVVRGFGLTSSRKAYGKRLFLLALVSQLPFVAAFGLHHRLNVLFELSGILLVLSGFRQKGLERIVRCLAGFLLCLSSEYELTGLLLGIAFDRLRAHPVLRTLVCFLLAGCLNSGWYRISALAVLLVAVGERSGWNRSRSSRLCYLIYPAHLVLFAGLKQWLG